MTLWRVVVVAALCLAATGCASVARRDDADRVGSRATPPAEGFGSRPRVSPPEGTRSKPEVSPSEGKASWYGAAHQGKKTASGEIYDMNKLTAAHRTLPLGTRVRVTNVDNGRSVVVRINDRGPFIDGRVIDLSQAAARELGALGTGLFTVRLDVLEDAASDLPSAPASR